jgi:heme-degrading monooxygenase HmoA
MIARTWRGWTTPANANSYENFLKQKLLPGLRALEGYRGGQVLRRDLPDESEFVVINYFDSLEAVKRFAGENYTVAAR